MAWWGTCCATWLHLKSTMSMQVPAAAATTPWLSALWLTCCGCPATGTRPCSWEVDQSQCCTRLRTLPALVWHRPSRRRVLHLRYPLSGCLVQVDPMLRRLVETARPSRAVMQAVHPQSSATVPLLLCRLLHPRAHRAGTTAYTRTPVVDGQQQVLDVW